MRKITVCCLLLIAMVACNGGEDIRCVRNGVHLPTADSKAVATRVIEYRPAPGQFIGEPMMGFSGSETTQDAANLYSENRLMTGQLISLGGFGGYIIVAFDHSIEAWGKQGGDFTIAGNAFDGSNEPGIVWVMSDDNGDNIPNETWYELQGAHSVTHNYSVTYHRVSDTVIEWEDNAANNGTIDRIAEHTQVSYYPQWISDESYTLTGSMLASLAFVEPSGRWNTGNYGWGYVDNFGSDTGIGSRTRFFINNAVDTNGVKVAIKAIDFVKIQTAVNAQCGGLGELSTELCEIRANN